jgi:hypothetical protein
MKIHVQGFVLEQALFKRISWLTDKKEEAVKAASSRLQRKLNMLLKPKYTPEEADDLASRGFDYILPKEARDIRNDVPHFNFILNRLQRIHDTAKSLPPSATVTLEQWEWELLND